MSRIRIFLLYFFLSIPVFSQTSISSLQNKLRKSRTDQEKIDLYLSISRYYQKQQADSATHYAIEGLRLATHISSTKAKGQMLYQLGVINVAHHNLSTARHHLDAALAIFIKLKERRNLILVYQELGILEGKAGNIGKATVYLNKAIELSVAVKDTVDMIQSYLKLGCIEELNDHTDKALGYYKKAELLNKSLPLSKINLAILEHIGRVHLKNGNHEYAIKNFRKGLENTTGSKHARNHISYLTQTGDAYKASGSDDSALKYHKDALSKAQEFSLPEEQARVLIKIADIVKRSDSDKSLQHLHNALQIAKGITNDQLQAEVYKAMSGIYRQQERYNEALFALEQQHSLLDSLFIINKVQEQAGLEAKNALVVSTENLEMERHERKLGFSVAAILIISLLVIALVIWQNARKTRVMNARLAESNLVKDRLFSIIGHDLRGPIGNMTQLLSILESDEMPPEERKELFGIMKQQCDASFEVLTSLLNWGKIQLQGATVSMANFEPKYSVDKNIRVLANQAKAKSVNISNHIPTELFVFADEAHFDFIIRNLLSNAIKFSHKGGTIEINRQQVNDNIFEVFSVKDNGLGISAEQQQQFLKSNMNVAYGTDGEKGTGLGLLLIKEFVQANGGKLWLESEAGKGTVFYFSLKKT